jgi:hypothetical protein
VTQRSFPFDSTGIANEGDWASLMGWMLPTGVRAGDLNSFALGTTSGLNQDIQSGRSFMNGMWHESNATVTKTVATNAPNGSSRIDRIALKKDTTANTVDIVVVPGTAGAGIPALTNTASITYSKLYRLTLNANSATINSTVDEREYCNRPRWNVVGAGANPAFENSWVQYNSGGYSDVAYYLDPMGFVHLRGLCKNGTIGSSIFTLPAGYQPPYKHLFPAASNTAFDYVTVSAAGAVVAETTTGASNTWVSLDGISFGVTGL